MPGKQTYKPACGSWWQAVTKEVQSWLSAAAADLHVAVQLKVFFPEVTVAKPKSSRNSSIGKALCRRRPVVMPAAECQHTRICRT